MLQINSYKTILKALSSKRGAILLVMLITFFTSTSQKVEKIYDEDWKECAVDTARYYSFTTKTDSGFYQINYYISENKVQMKGLFTDEKCSKKNGYFYYFHNNGNISSYGKYNNNEKEGVWISAHRNGFIKDSFNYKNGKLVDVNYSWHSNAYLKDSITVNEDGSAVVVSWFDNGNLAAAGRLDEDGEKKGTWAYYYHHQNQMSCKVLYKNGEIEEVEYYDSKGNLEEATGKRNRLAVFSTTKSFSEYINKNVYFPEQYTITNSGIATVTVEFDIDEEGNIANIEITASFERAFDDILLRAIKRCPKWHSPKIEFNRAVKSHHTQSLRFSSAPR